MSHKDDEDWRIWLMIIVIVVTGEVAKKAPRCILRDEMSPKKVPSEELMSGG